MALERRANHRTYVFVADAMSDRPNCPYCTTARNPVPTLEGWRCVNCQQNYSHCRQCGCQVAYLSKLCGECACEDDGL